MEKYKLRIVELGESLNDGRNGLYFNFTSYSELTDFLLTHMKTCNTVCDYIVRDGE